MKTLWILTLVCLAIFVVDAKKVSFASLYVVVCSLVSKLDYERLSVLTR